MTKYWSLPRGTMTLVSRRVCGGIVGQDYVEWAVGALMEDFDSPSLGILATLDIGGPVSQFEAREYFLKAVRELALPIPDVELALSLPDDEAVLRQHLNELAEQISDGVIDPVTGFDRIHLEVVDRLGHPEDLMPWCYLWERIRPEGIIDGHSKEESATALVTFAILWLENLAGKTRA